MAITRRTLLKNMSLGAGSLVLEPILSQLEAHADGSGRMPKRVVIVLHNNGFHAWAAQPKDIEPAERNGPDKVTNIPLAGHELPDALSPLAPCRDLVTIIQKLNGVHCGPYHGGGYAALAGVRKSFQPYAESIDAALAKANRGVFPIVGLGIDTKPKPEGGSVYVCSAMGPNQPVAIQCNPDLAYKTLFGSVASDSARQTFDDRTHLLDFMKDDVKSVRSRLAGPERDKFDYYLNAFEAMGQRQVKLQEMAGTLRKSAPSYDEKKYTSTNEVQRTEAQFDLASGALISGLTRVVTICSGLCSPSGQWTGLGINIGNHGIGHGGSDLGRSSKELYTIIRRFHFEQIAGLIKKLQAMPEGDGTMMDNTVIVYTSDAAGNHHADGKEWPFVLIGSLGKRLRTGRFIEYPGYGQAGNRTINALYCTLLHAAGAPRDHFNLEGGLKEIDQHGPLAELLV